jgi:hypothetical protein
MSLVNHYLDVSPFLCLNGWNSSDKTATDNFNSGELTAWDASVSANQTAQQTYSTAADQATSDRTAADQTANDAFNQVQSQATATMNAAIAAALQAYGVAVGSPGAVPYLPNYTYQQLGIPDPNADLSTPNPAMSAYMGVYANALTTYTASVDQAKLALSASNSQSDQQYTAATTAAQAAYDTSTADAIDLYQQTVKGDATSSQQSVGRAQVDVIQAWKDHQQQFLTSTAAAAATDASAIDADAQTEKTTETASWRQYQQAILRDQAAYDAANAGFKSTLTAAIQRATSPADVFTALTTYVQSQSTAGTTQSNADSQAAAAYTKAVNGAIADQLTADAQADDDLAHADDTAAAKEVTDDAKSAKEYIKAVDLAHEKQSEDDAKAEEAESKSFDKALAAGIQAVAQASNTLSHAQNRDQETYAKAVSLALKTKTLTESTAGAAATQASASQTAAYDAAYLRVLSSSPNSGPLVAYYQAIKSASSAYSQAVTPAGIQRSTALATNLNEYETSLAGAQKTFNDSMADNNNTYLSAVVPQLKQALDSLAGDAKTATIAIAKADQTGNDTLADDEETEVDAEVSADKSDGDTLADDGKTEINAVVTAALSDANQLTDDAKAAATQVDAATEQSLNDAFGAAVAYAATLLPQSDQQVLDGSYVVGFTQVDAQGNVWVKRYLPLPGNQTGSTWYYRSLGEVQGSVGQTFADQAAQASFWNGFFYSGNRNNPPTVPVTQSSYNGGPLESATNAFWSAFGNRVALTATGALAGAGTGASSGAVVGGVTTLGGGALPGLIGGAISGALAGAFNAAYNTETLEQAATGGAYSGAVVGACAPLEAAAFGAVAAKLKCVPLVNKLFGTSGGCFVPGTPVRLCSQPALMLIGADSTWEQLLFDTEPSTTTMAIEKVSLGSRVPDQNPCPEDYDDSLGDVHPVTWKQVDFTLKRDDGALIEVELLRPEAWVEALALKVGSELSLTMSEFDVSGNAIVTGIHPCVEIDDGPGSVVTGRFVTRQVNNLLRITLENGTVFTGTTTHPVWLADKKSWVTLEEIQPGDILDGVSGPLVVSQVVPEPVVSDVYNIEVHGHHVYRITDDGILVHNNSSSGWNAANSGKAFTVDSRVVGQLADSRLGPLAGKFTPQRLHDLVNSPTARRVFDSRTGNVNIIQEVEGRLIRITVAGDKFKIISVGPIQERNILNLIENGGYVPIGATP